ncbi:benzoate/H(+) symporter BenE family transporter [Cryobacterium sp. TMT2-4]|uniref:benzoate/H(+) symporter BenE family transporter n=1 Tax=Cryobacterium sp. TMT2-4 TaxID=1259254 RepID=UPI00210837FD|nr:benzoate/H(+) symporter BenE family transporter [Cryobacterium sp. TMT2-4]
MRRSPDSRVHSCSSSPGCRPWARPIRRRHPCCWRPACWSASTACYIPKPIASAMLAGILFPICPAPVTAAVQQPLLAVPVVLVWLAAGKPARAWMVPATMVVAAIIDVRLPASALRDLVGSGLANAVGSVVGALGITLTAITTAPMAGPDAHPDGPKRWIATAASGAACLVLVTASGVSVLGIGSAFGGWSSAAWSCSGSAGCPPGALTQLPSLPPNEFDGDFAEIGPTRAECGRFP